MKRLIVLAALLSLAGCYEEPVKFSEQRDVYMVTDTYKSKYTKVDLKNTRTGQMWFNQSLGYCYYKDIKVGSLWDITEVVYRYPESDRFKSMLIGLTTICPR